MVQKCGTQVLNDLKRISNLQNKVQWVEALSLNPPLLGSLISQFNDTTTANLATIRCFFDFVIDKVSKRVVTPKNVAVFSVPGHLLLPSV